MRRDPPTIGGDRVSAAADPGHRAAVEAQIPGGGPAPDLARPGCERLLSPGPGFDGQPPPQQGDGPALGPHGESDSTLGWSIRCMQASGAVHRGPGLRGRAVAARGEPGPRRRSRSCSDARVSAAGGGKANRGVAEVATRPPGRMARAMARKMADGARRGRRRVPGGPARRRQGHPQEGGWAPTTAPSHLRRGTGSGGPRSGSSRHPHQQRPPPRRSRPRIRHARSPSTWWPCRRTRGDPGRGRCRRTRRRRRP